jgi:hypothetical protein
MFYREVKGAVLRKSWRDEGHTQAPLRFLKFF